MKYFSHLPINPIWELNSIFPSEFIEFCEKEIFGYEQSDVVYKRPKHHSDEVKISYLMFLSRHVCGWNPIWSPEFKMAAKNIRNIMFLNPYTYICCHGTGSKVKSMYYVLGHIYASNWHELHGSSAIKSNTAA